VYAAAFSSDGRLLVTASHDGALKLWAWPALALRGSVAMSKSLEAMAPVSLVIGRQGALAAANGLLGRVHVVESREGARRAHVRQHAGGAGTRHACRDAQLAGVQP
jgi:hypothetical protein